MSRRSLQLLLCLLFSVPFVLAQTGPDTAAIAKLAAYYPLHKGDTWRYSKPGGGVLTISVSDTVTQEGTSYAEITESFSRGQAPPVERKYYLRRGIFGRVLKLILPCARKARVPAERGLCALAGTDWIWFDFGGKDQGAWQSFGNGYSGVDEYLIRRLAAHDTVRTADTVFTHCQKFQIHPIGSSDNDVFEWFAPGVGMVRRGWEGDGTEDFRLVEFHVSP